MAKAKITSIFINRLDKKDVPCVATTAQSKIILLAFMLNPTTFKEKPTRFKKSET